MLATSVIFMSKANNQPLGEIRPIWSPWRWLTYIHTSRSRVNFRISLIVLSKLILSSGISLWKPFSSRIHQFSFLVLKKIVHMYIYLKHRCHVHWQILYIYMKSFAEIQSWDQCFDFFKSFSNFWRKNGVLSHKLLQVCAKNTITMILEKLANFFAGNG
jgi:hypothetical protein